VVVEAASPEAIERAARLLRAGELVAFPTETVYGLGADARDGRAVARIFEAKGRPRFNPLIVHVTDLAEAERIALVGDAARALAQRFWPGPLTLVMRARPGSGISELATAGLDTIAVRVPSHPIALALLSASGLPIAAPSANISGHVSPTLAAHVAADLGDKVSLILDGGPCRYGLESTIVDASEEKLVLLRAGAVTAGEIEAASGRKLARLSHDAGERPSAPGQLESHYAPRALLRLDAQRAEPGEALLAFGPRPAQHDGPMFNLSTAGDLLEAAANLFAALRELDRPDVTAIAVMAIPETGLGEAINDRLRRGAAPRPAA
jgi:L-threonylcarbamoyladenylate synthase